MKDASHITAARPKRGSASGDDSGGEGSPNAKNNAAGCSDTWWVAGVVFHVCARVSLQPVKAVGCSLNDWLPVT